MTVELGRSVHINFNLENVEELTEFIDGLVLPGEKQVVPNDSHIASSGRTLFLSSFGLSTSDMFVQLEAPRILGKPTLLGSVVGIEAKASLKPDLQGSLYPFSMYRWLVTPLLCNIVELIDKSAVKSRLLALGLYNFVRVLF